MCKSRQATRITRRAYTVLAALLLADGDWVSAQSLALGLFEHPIHHQAIRKHLWALQRFGITTVTRHWRNSRSRGYRLTDLPGDEHLEPMLATVRAVRQSRWWQERTAMEVAA